MSNWFDTYIFDRPYFRYIRAKHDLVTAIHMAVNPWAIVVIPAAVAGIMVGVLI